jgi:hypothetical protein
MIGVESININPDTIQEALLPIPSKLNNLSVRTIQEYGDQYITSIVILKTPLEKYIEGALNVMSFGKFGDLKRVKRGLRSGLA